MTRFTASEAKELAGKTVTEKVDDILTVIKERATNKERFLRTGYQYTNDEDLWIQGGYSETKEWKEAKKQLEELGFKVTFYYKELQFVDMYTLIEW
jgi:hypothetical protein